MCSAGVNSVPIHEEGQAFLLLLLLGLSLCNNNDLHLSIISVFFCRKDKGPSFLHHHHLNCLGMGVVFVLFDFGRSLNIGSPHTHTRPLPFLPLVLPHFCITHTTHTPHTHTPHTHTLLSSLQSLHLILYQLPDMDLEFQGRLGFRGTGLGLGHEFASFLLDSPFPIRIHSINSYSSQFCSSCNLPKVNIWRLSRDWRNRNRAAGRHCLPALWVGHILPHLHCHLFYKLIHLYPATPAVETELGRHLFRHGITCPSLPPSLLCLPATHTAHNMYMEGTWHSQTCCIWQLRGLGVLLFGKRNRLFPAHTPVWWGMQTLSLSFGCLQGCCFLHFASRALTSEHTSKISPSCEKKAYEKPSQPPHL